MNNMSLKAKYSAIALIIIMSLGTEAHGMGIGELMGAFTRSNTFVKAADETMKAMAKQAERMAGKAAKKAAESNATTAVVASASMGSALVPVLAVYAAVSGGLYVFNKHVDHHLASKKTEGNIISNFGGHYCCNETDNKRYTCYMRGAKPIVLTKQDQERKHLYFARLENNKAALITELENKIIKILHPQDIAIPLPTQESADNVKDIDSKLVRDAAHFALMGTLRKVAVADSSHSSSSVPNSKHFDALAVKVIAHSVHAAENVFAAKLEALKAKQLQEENDWQKELENAKAQTTKAKELIAPKEIIEQSTESRRTISPLRARVQNKSSQILELQKEIAKMNELLQPKT